MAVVQIFLEYTMANSFCGYCEEVAAPQFFETEPFEFWRGVIDLAAGENHGLRVTFIVKGDDEQVEILGPLPSELRRCLQRVVPFGQLARRGQLPWGLYDITWSLNSTGDGPRFGISNSDVLIGLLSARRLKLSGKDLTLSYAEVGKKRLRPDGRMPPGVHARVALALKIVYDQTYGGIFAQAGVTRRLHQVISTLDNWMMFEYGSNLPDDQFWKGYFGAAPQTGLYRSSKFETHQCCVEFLKKVKITLTTYYPDCPPLLEVLHKLDRVMEVLRDR